MAMVTPPRKKRRYNTRSTGQEADDGAKEVGNGLPITNPPKQIPHVFNNNYTVTLTYADRYDLEVDYNHAASQIWRMNSIYDPDWSGVGHQPLGRDLWTSMYNYYTVLSCEYEIWCYNAFADDSQKWTTIGNATQLPGSVQLALLPCTNTADVTTSSTGLYPIHEQKNVQSYFLAPQEKICIKGSLTPGDFLIEGKDADNDRTWTDVGSNPAIDRYIGLHGSSTQYNYPTGSDHAAWSLIQIFAKLKYTVQFCEVATSYRNVPS